MTEVDIVAILVGVLIGTIVKAIAGMGLPLFAIPIAALFVGVETAVVVVGLPNLVSNSMLMVEHRSGSTETSYLRELIGWGVVGAAVGTALLASLDERILMLVLAVAVAVYLVVSLRDQSFAWSPTVARRGTPAVGFAGGLFQGAIGISGPIVASWIHGLRLSRPAFVYTISTMFGITTAIQLVSITVLGLWTVERFVLAIVGSVLVALVTPVMMRVGRKVSGVWFDHLILGLLALSAVSLVLRAVI